MNDERLITFREAKSREQIYNRAKFACVNQHRTRSRFIAFIAFVNPTEYSNVSLSLRSTYLVLWIYYSTVLLAQETRTVCFASRVKYGYA